MRDTSTAAGRSRSQLCSRHSPGRDVAVAALHSPGRGCGWPGRCCQPELTPCPGSQLRPLFLLALADFLAAAVLLSTATIQLLPAPLFIPAYAACPYGLMLATVSGAARTVTWAHGTCAPPPVLLGKTRPICGLEIPGQVPCGELFLLPRAVSSSPSSGLSHHDCFLGEARAAAPGRSALQPPPRPSRHPHALPPAWGGKPNAAVPVPWGRAERGSPWCRCARPFVPKLCARPQSHWRLSALPGAGAHHGQHHSPPAPASSCWPQGYCLLGTHGDRDREGLSTLGTALLLVQPCCGDGRRRHAEQEEGWGPVPLGHWAKQEPVFPLLSQTFYAVSFLMVVVYAYEAYRTIHGWRAWHMAALQVGVPQMWHSRASLSPCTAAPAPRWPGKQRGQPWAAPFPAVLLASPAPCSPARSQQSRAGASSCCGTGRAG